MSSDTSQTRVITIQLPGPGARAQVRAHGCIVSAHHQGLTVNFLLDTGDVLTLPLAAARHLATEARFRIVGSRVTRMGQSVRVEVPQ
ncbi:MAG: hypothetical protein ACYC9X_03905 [Dehalococcoidia bacterium]